MNRSQKLILIFLIVITLLIGFFPPWRYDIGSSINGIHKGIGFHFLWSNQHIGVPPVYLEPHIDATKLMVEWVTLLLVSASSLLLFRKRRDKV